MWIWIVIAVVGILGLFIWGTRCPRCGKFFAASSTGTSNTGSWWNRREYKHFSCSNCAHTWKREVHDDVC